MLQALLAHVEQQLYSKHDERSVSGKTIDSSTLKMTAQEPFRRFELSYVVWSHQLPNRAIPSLKF
jgi:hypothetical protein